MNESYKKWVIGGLAIVIVLLAWLAFGSTSNDKRLNTITNETPAETTPDNERPEASELMDLVVYLQDKDAAAASDCGVTYAKTIQVPQTKAVAQASLEYLFENELSRYAEFESVNINNGVAKVTLFKDNDPQGLKISSLSSCESRHLMSVLSDTLTQYDSINSVELYSEAGKIEF